MNKLEKKLTAFLDAFADEYSIPGYDCVVYHHHAPIYRRMRGYADVEALLPISENTLYHIYSNTKVIACVAAMQLFEQGLFNLDDPFSMYFPDFASVKVKDADGTLRSPKRPVLIRDLFTMTAGIGDGSDAQDMGRQFYMETGGSCSIQALPKFLAQMPLRFDPGEGFFYGICHEMLAALIEKLSGETFGDYLAKHIFQPLGMKNTAFRLEDCESKEIAMQYSIQGEGQPMKAEGNHNLLIPPILKESASGGLISSTDDYMKFQEALCRENVLLKKETTDLMRRNHLNGVQFDGYGYTQFGLGYGLGVRAVRNDQNPNAVGPYGWGGAAGTLGLIDPENELTMFYAQQMFGTRDIQGCGELAKVVYEAL